MRHHLFHAMFLTTAFALPTPVFANDSGFHQPPIVKPCIPFKDGQILFLRGDIVMSAINAESEGQPPHTYFLFLLEEPICLGGNSKEKFDRLEAYPVAPKWLGHYVEIRGAMAAGDAWSLDVKGIRDAPAK